ncbi:malonic semialdehyde reductase [Herbaspirillum robiniae]|uniref:Putative NADH dehydrogenase/NAD(P)H nitroreductase HNO84_21125 n=1 Tax=Herbaspirillum robiniae TaxID=2014887 RepID=A0ABX2M425_9BURK|nr:malonic semialdehyde reductase [Herbaspirillum robiniae]NUU04120.1 malonic semialdehyde reductase [Herbaspirillum robiniae]
MSSQDSIAQDALDRLFLQARSQNGWLPKPVDDEQLRRLYDLMKMAPTSANCSPARIVFLRSAQAKERLRPALSAGNVEKAMSAPVVAVIGYDTQFHELLPQLFPHNPAMRELFAGNAALAQATAVRNGSLQGAYLMLAARAIGLDVGPMSGFDAEQVNAAFFADGRCRVNFICNLGYGDPDKLFPRSPRLDFDQACTLL